MAEVQDEDQWLYGDGKEDGAPTKEPETVEKEQETEKAAKSPVEEAGETVTSDIPASDEPPASKDDEEKRTEEIEAEKENDEREEGEADPETETQEEGGVKKTEEDDTSSDDEPTVTIGKIVKQPDIIRAPQPTHRAAPTTGPKDEDFEGVGKINDVPITDYNLNEFEDKPWRKPGADLSDYFNYGFTEETWVRYCERQKTLRLQESQVGLAGLGGQHKSGNVPVTITTGDNKYVNGRGSKSSFNDSQDDNSQMNTIQVMTAEKRTYSNKVLSTYENNDFSTPPPYGNFYNRPPPTAPIYSAPPPFDSQGAWPSVPNVPPPGYGPESGPPPPTDGPYYDESSSHSHPRDRERDRSLDRDRERSLDRNRERSLDRNRERSLDRDRDRDRTVDRERDRERDRTVDRERDRTVDRERETDSHRSRDRESRHHRRRSRSRSKTRHRKRSRSRSRSPSHRHKRKKSKRDAE